MESSRRVGAQLAPTPVTTDPASKASSQPPATMSLLVVSCAGPLLLGVLAASGAGAWLVTHGYTIGGPTVLVVAGLLAWRIRVRIRRE